MKTLHGVSLVKGIAFGKIQFKNSNFDIKKSNIKNNNSEVEKEIFNLNSAVKLARQELEDLKNNSLNMLGSENAEIFETHIMMIEDEDFTSAIRNRIKNKLETAAYAIFKVSNDFAQNFLNLDDEYMRLRSADILDVGKRIVACLYKKDNKTNNFKKSNIDSDEGIILVANDFTPSDIMALDNTKIKGIVALHGSSNSHMAILTKARGIPTIIGIKNKFQKNYDGSKAILDGISGVLHISPDFFTFLQSHQKRDIFLRQNELLKLLENKETVTKDGKKIKLYVNITSVDELKYLKDSNIDGIGLFRTEFIFLDKNEPPSEENQFKIYKDIVSMMKNKPVIFRTADFGADKKPSFIKFPSEENPAMGYRGIRVSFDYLELFKSQIKAIFRASMYGNVLIMFPMITTLEEVLKIKKIIKKIKKELDDLQIPYKKDIQIGIMIETPAAVLISDELAKHVDFFSIGTNDLTQYTLALDRQNNKVNKFFNSKHPAILKMIEIVTKNAHANGIWAGICGEMASDLTLTQEFLRLSIDELSMSQIFILGVKKMILETDVSAIQKLIDKK